MQALLSSLFPFFPTREGDALRGPYGPGFVACRICLNQYWQKEGSVKKLIRTAVWLHLQDETSGAFQGCYFAQM